MTRLDRPSARCRTLLPMLSRYLDGDLTLVGRRKVERHVNRCTCCGTMVARLQSAVVACRAEGGRRPPRDVMSRAAERIRVLISREGRQPASAPQRQRSTSGPPRR